MKKIHTAAIMLLGTGMLALAGSHCAQAASGKTVRITYMEWPCAVASSNLVKAVIEERLFCPSFITKPHAVKQPFKVPQAHCVPAVLYF